jgi:glycosyltransferase involved in cell wall biosynthesis
MSEGTKSIICNDVALSSSPLVSIVVPTYNRGLFIAEMIESVCYQTYSNWELIIIDDGSTDNTEQIVKPYISEKIHYRRLAHVGRSYARNLGLNISKGSFIAYLDSDDLFLPTKIEKQIQWLLKNPSTAMVYTSALIIDDNGDYIPAVYYASASGNIYEKVALFVPVTITLPSVMIRREIQDVVGGFDEKLDRFEDTDMWRRVARDYIIDAMSEPLIKVRTHQGNRIEALDPAKLCSAVKKYVQKVKKDDGKEHRVIVAKGAARLFLHYRKAFLERPEWNEFSRDLLIEAYRHQPFYTTMWLIKQQAVVWFKAFLE